MPDPLACLENNPPWLIDEIAKIVRRQDSWEKFMARREQAAAARELGTERKSVNGLGRVRAEINPKSYHYWGQRLGYECWKDKKFLHEFERDNPDVRVKCGGTKLQVGYGHLSAGARKKFEKSYG